jgi:LuxR family transcriptional regulator, maltose regulon positive regulatory protein
VLPAYGRLGTVGGEGDALEVVFPFTKFVPPQLDDRIAVQRIVGTMSAAVAERPLTVVVAPAGSGKTTALAAWVRATSDPVAWVRAGSEDDAPNAIAAALLAGVRQVVEGFGPRLEAVLGASGAALSTHHLVTALANDLGEVERLAVVLDDAHELVARDTWVLLDGLLDHLPPDVRLLVGSRTEPALSLSRRRVRGEVAEIGLDGLRLDRAEIREVLAADVEDHGIVDAVVRASGGWAAAVRLATARLRATPDGVSDGFDPVAAAQPDLWRFLAEEVLGSQPPDLRGFLLETSILDELTAHVCTAVTGRTDGADVLDGLERRNLFVARFAGGSGPAWRYHDLFAAFLRDRLHADRPQDAVDDLHRRAAAALPPAQAVPHLLAAGEHDRVAELVLAISLEELDAGVLALVLPWVESLPQEVIERHPRLALVLAWPDEMAGRPTEILNRLEPLHAKLVGAGDELAAAELGLEIAVAHMMRGDHDRAGSLIDEALRLPLDDWVRLMALVTNIHARRDLRDWSGSSESLSASFDLALGADRPGVVQMLATGMSYQLLFADQGPAWVMDRAERLRSLVDTPGAAIGLAGLRPLLAGAALLRLDLETAADEVRRCLSTSRELGGLVWTQQEAEVLLLSLSLATGDHAAVRGIVADAFARMERSPVDASMRYAYAHAEARSAWLRGDRPRLDLVVERVSGAERQEEDVVRAVVGAMVARMDGRGLDEAAAALVEAELVQRELRAWFGVGLPGLERAAILHEQGRTRRALEAAEPTLAAATELGPGILLADVSAHVPLLQRCLAEGLHAATVGSVLAALERPTRVAALAVPGTAESLSAREVEVLGHVAEGRSNREIADELFISDVTVKSHLTRIFRKLDASSRTHAVARARELHLL